jgi:hypothetical protein
MTFMIARSDYPISVAHILDDRKTFRPAALREMRAFRRSKPWWGTLEQRAAKLTALNVALAAAYGIPAPRLIVNDARPEVEGVINGNGSYDPATHTIRLIGSISVVTYLHEFAHARFGPSERKAVYWSINLFRKVFPRSYSRLHHDGYLLTRRHPPNHRPEADMVGGPGSAPTRGLPDRSGSPS